MSLRGLLKGSLERAFGSRLALVIGSAMQRGSRLVLAYHNIVPDGVAAGGDASLHLPLAHFRSQLTALDAAALPVVRIDAPLTPAAGPQVAITFDDAYASALTLAVPELQARGLPATVFVAPGLLGVAAPWWDRLADPELGGIEQVRRVSALYDLEGDGDRILETAGGRGWALTAGSPLHRIASEADVARAIGAHGGLTLGAHTWSHPNLAAVSADRLQLELRRPLEWLQARWPARVIPWFAYPYGLHSVATRAATARAGYVGAFLVTGGWHRTRGDAHAVPRFNVTPGLSPMGFRARLTGFL